jgi:integrase
MGKARKRSHGTGTVFARPNGKFTAQMTDDGTRRSIGTFPTRKAAEAALAAALIDGPPSLLDSTLAEYLADWLIDQALTVKATTEARNRNLMNRYVISHRIGRRRVRDLVPTDFRSLYRDLADHGKVDGSGLGAGSIKTIEQILRGAIQQLVDDRELRWHPMPRRAVKTVKTERPYLNREQLRELIRFARFRYPDLEVVLRLGGLAGFRRGEICGLRWSDLDFSGGSVIIRRNRVVANGIVSESSPKTEGSMARIVLDDATVDALQRHRKRREELVESELRPSEYVVCSSTGDGLDPNNLARSFRRLIGAYTDAGTRPELPHGLSLHCLRHSFASNLVASGVNLKVAAEAMRHSNTRMMDRYAHLSGSTVGDAVRALAAQVGA